jgi:transposase
MSKIKEKSSIGLRFKAHKRDQEWLFPPSIGEMIPLDHPVRFIDKAVNEFDISSILSSYKPGGASIYHPRVLIKLLVYGYMDRKYSSRDLEKALHENVVYMWLCSMNKPDHVTISNFRSKKLKGEIKSIFAQVLKQLYKHKIISLKTQVVDGTKIESVANRFSYVWAKNISRFKGSLEQKIESLLEEVESYINNENIETTNQKDEPLATQKPKIETNEKESEQKNSSEKIEERLSNIPELPDKEINKKVEKIKKKHLPKLKTYEAQEEILDGRNSYSKTDPDATFMRMKRDRLGKEQLKPAYNLQLSSENQYIINYSIHQNTNDAFCYKVHTTGTLQMLEESDLPKFQQANGDSIYGTEENYTFLIEKQIENYLKYPSFHAEKKHDYKKYPFHTRTLYYNEKQDYYICPMGQKMLKSETRKKETKTGFKSEVIIYRAQNCKNCPLRGQCLKGESERSVQRNHNLEKYRETARNNLNSDQGKILRSKRSVDVEPIFGHIKYNRFFDRLMLVGIEKIEVELGLHAIAHNLKKMMKNLQKWTNIPTEKIISTLKCKINKLCYLKCISDLNLRPAA